MFKGHPKGLIPAALSNMGERFGYYIMNAVLLLFLCSKFGLSDETSGAIYSVFYCLIYVLSLVGGVIADRTQNYKGTIRWGLIIMALGYALISIPILATKGNISWLLPFTCVALLLIAFGNGLFKGNLQAIVGQMYDNVEAEAAKQGPEALKAVQGKRDSGFQIFYVFINIGGLVAPFIAPYLRQWWLGVNDLTYNAELPALCHQFINGAQAMTGEAMSNLNTLATQVSGSLPTDMGAFCQKYLEVFNTGVHYSFIASVCAMLISLCIFLFRSGLPVLLVPFPLYILRLGTLYHPHESEFPGAGSEHAGAENVRHASVPAIYKNHCDGKCDEQDSDEGEHPVHHADLFFCALFLSLSPLSLHVTPPKAVTMPLSVRCRRRLRFYLPPRKFLHLNIKHAYMCQIGAYTDFVS